MKLDISKAYDSLNWLAFIKVLRKIGFEERWIGMIWRHISNCWYSVMINGQICGYFSSNRGLRQEDPLSPILFIIATEVFSRGLNNLHERYNSLGYQSTNDGLHISHLSYADDVIIFCNGARQSLKRCMNFLDNFHKFCGLESKISFCNWCSQWPKRYNDQVHYWFQEK